jgi:hypothetical protein
MQLVIRTRSVEFMPLSLTAGTLVCSTMWFLRAAQPRTHAPPA